MATDKCSMIDDDAFFLYSTQSSVNFVVVDNFVI